MQYPFLRFKHDPLGKVEFVYCDFGYDLSVPDHLCPAEQTAVGRKQYPEKIRLLPLVLEILTSFEKASASGQFYPLKTRYNRTQPMQNNPMHGILD